MGMGEGTFWLTPSTVNVTKSVPVPRVGFPQRSVQRLPNGRVISRLQPFVYLQASEFACHPGRSHRRVPSPMPRAAVAFTSEQNMRRYLHMHQIC